LWALKSGTPLTPAVYAKVIVIFLICHSLFNISINNYHFLCELYFAKLDESGKIYSERRADEQMFFICPRALLPIWIFILEA